MKRLALLLLLLLPASSWCDEQRRAMTLADFFSLKRVADPQISPDGQWVAYAVGTVDMEANKILYHLWLAPASGTGAPRQLTNAAKSDRQPRWSPDSKSILFESSRGGTPQLWLIDTSGGEARQLTHISTGASSGTWSRDGKQIACVSAVWPEFSAKPFKESDALNKKRMDEHEKSPVKARVFTRLFFRHWDSYVENKRQHLFVMSYENGKAGEPRDVTPGDRDAYPTSSTFSSSVDFTFSPDGKYLVFTAVPEKDEAWSTNYDICRVPVTGGTAKWECLTPGNPAADSGPQFSPDGKQLAYRAQQHAGFEADTWQLMMVECAADGKFAGAARSVSHDLTGKKELSVDEFVWTGAKRLSFTADEKGSRPLFQVFPFAPAAEKAVVTQGGLGMHTSLSASRAGEQVAFTSSLLSEPPEAIACIGDLRAAVVHNVSRVNEKLLSHLELPRSQSVTVPGAGGTPMQMWILKPPGFDAKKKWPLVYLVHGGPQGAWEDNWSWRWNPELWAAQGYVVALPNPRGSTGFGQKYVNEISGDWGGKCYEDLMAGLAYLEKQPYIDTERMAAAGGSFGGYMMNWFAVNTGKFKTLITHCGVWNFDSMYATTEELWFDEWEHGGPPWGKNRHSYEKHSPHRLAANLAKYKTPMLVIHNDLDYRVPVSEGIQLFTTLQRLGVPSRFVNFPDEGHWVLKPRNSERWHREVFAWLKKHVTPGGH
jgi:dipeptidyl aminopeptidase/acylaminoacyl peptidase